MSDLLRKLDNLIRVGRIVEVNLSSAPAMVRVEVDEGVKSDWMPFSQAFIGQTVIWCAPKIGMSGLVVSEGGENRVNRFFPCFNDSSNAPALGEDDFKILLKNGDSIHHDSGSGILTVDSTTAVIVNSQKAEVNAPQITLNGDTTITKTLTVQGFASLNGGFAMNAGATRSTIYQAMSANYSLMSSNVRSSAVGTINIPIIVNATMTYNIDPVLHGVPYLEHTHTDVKAGGDNTGGVA